ncbi:MAG: cbb3-type cytochrome oxidase assembly protein CcoS [Pirellulales bacterium]
MSVLFVALPAAILLAASAVVAFIWATRRGQFDDLETPRWRILLDDDPQRPKED